MESEYITIEYDDKYEFLSSLVERRIGKDKDIKAIIVLYEE